MSYSKERKSLNDDKHIFFYNDLKIKHVWNFSKQEADDNVLLKI